MSLWKYLFLLFLPLSISASEWRYQENIDEMTDQDISIAWVKKLNCTSHCPSIVVRGDNNVIIKFQRFMNNGPIKVEYRFDKRKMLSFKADNSTDGTSAFLPHSLINEFVGKLMDYKELRVRAYDYNGTSHSFKVSLKGAKPEIKKVPWFKNAKRWRHIRQERDAEKRKKQQSNLARIENALEVIKSSQGKESEAYKVMKAQYEIERNKMNQRE